MKTSVTAYITQLGFASPTLAFEAPGHTVRTRSCGRQGDARWARGAHRTFRAATSVVRHVSDVAISGSLREKLTLSGLPAT